LRILIVGSDGTIGAALSLALRAKGHAVIGTTRRQANAKLPGAIFLDLSADGSVSLPDVDVAVICAALARFEDCRKHPELAQRVNVDRPIEIAGQVLGRGGRVLLLSTSAVFDCLTPHRLAEDPRAPRSAYGRLKAETESRLLEVGRGASVLRLTKVVRPNAGILVDWIDSLKKGRAVTAFDDHRFCPLPLDAVVEALVAVVESGKDGLFQISGDDDISYADAARHLAAGLGLSENSVSTAGASSGGIASDEMTPYTSLDTRRLTAMTGFVPPTAIEVLESVYGRILVRA
jgi:dTDP-4-dehydrorhamnose reductase